MPVYQAQQEFDETMLSLADSTVPCTVFVVDDGSTPPLAIRTTNPELRIRLVRLTRNQGIVAALNAGLKAAIAEGYTWIARIDAGDYAAPQRLERQIEYLENHPGCMLVGCDAIVRDEDGAYCFTIEPPRDPGTLANALHERAWLLHPGVMYRAAVFGDVGLYSDRFAAAEDYEMFLRIARRHEIGVVPETLLTYVTRMRSISARKTRTQAISRLRIQLRYFLWSRWICYYGVLSTLSTLFLPRGFKNAFKKKFIYAHRDKGAQQRDKENVLRVRSEA
jgi:glycosyltransferase involved in cell wall biosynthesis